VYFQERNVFDNVTVSNNTAGFSLECDSTDTLGCSFEHSRFDVFCTTYSAGDSCFHLVGGTSAGAALMTNDKIHVDGNLAASSGACPWSGGPTGCTAVFLLDGGDVFGTISGEPEQNAGTGYAFYSNLNTSENAVNVTGRFDVGNGGTRWGGTWTAGYAQLKQLGPQYMGTLTTTAASYDSFANTAISAINVQNFCFVTPNDSAAAGMATATYIGPSDYYWGYVNVHHPSSAGATFSVWCQ